MKDKFYFLIQTVTLFASYLIPATSGWLYFCIGIITMQGLSYFIDGYTLPPKEAHAAARQLSTTVFGLKIKAFATLFLAGSILFFKKIYA